MAKFDRWDPTNEKSLAWMVFKRHHTTLNGMIWSHEAAKRLTFSATRPFKETDHCDVLFSFAKGERRWNWKLGEWSKKYDDFNRWTRLSAVMAMKAYLETYVSQIVNAALESSPAVMLGGGRQIDGVVLLKSRPKYRYPEKTEPIVKGEWVCRAAAYRRLFGTDTFAPFVRDLDKLRKIRNDVGHSFGRDIKWLHLTEDLILKKLPKIDDAKLIRYLGLIEGVANSVERDLAGRFVGAYETIRLFHLWSKKQPRALPIGERASQFNKHFGHVTGDSCDKRYARDLLNYYDKM